MAVKLGPEYTGTKARPIDPTGVVQHQLEVKEKMLTLYVNRHASGVYLRQLHDGKVVKLVKE